ncbi:hypothetical protein V865_004556 [Kwoniella europaea PYCC6329]|uniref:Uncharacterized protein n=1 Tax=Kwoniella europaea PYCC6329 TaxID=1423913 RepID=A0AAX4KJ95_9TREE
MEVVPAEAMLIYIDEAQDAPLFVDDDDNVVDEADFEAQEDEEGEGGDGGGLTDIDIIKRITAEIEMRWDFKVPVYDGAPGPFIRPLQERWKWGWPTLIRFYKNRYRTLSIYCNRKFVTRETTNWLTLCLTHIWFYCKHHGRCHVSSLPFSIEARHPLRVSFGKRTHGRPMNSGWTVALPQGLGHFLEQTANIIPELWVINLLRGPLRRSQVGELVSTICKKEVVEELGVDIVTEMIRGVEEEDLYLDDNQIVIDPRPDNRSMEIDQRSEGDLSPPRDASLSPNAVLSDEEEDLQKAIALSLRDQKKSSTGATPASLDQPAIAWWTGQDIDPKLLVHNRVGIRAEQLVDKLFTYIRPRQENTVETGEVSIREALLELSRISPEPIEFLAAFKVSWARVTLLSAAD